jgi:hypothetical protein
MVALLVSILPHICPTMPTTYPTAAQCCSFWLIGWTGCGARVTGDRVIPPHAPLTQPHAFATRKPNSSRQTHSRKKRRIASLRTSESVITHRLLTIFSSRSMQAFAPKNPLHYCGVTTTSGRRQCGYREHSPMARKRRRKPTR